ncbi:MAG: PIG-L family deacetylase [Kiritimatiellae bacterium]|nr:PIG-L family deacetylase [Kiritimatiellia bacterium]
MKKAIMAIGAHADDIELRAAGTLAKYQRMGYAAVCVVASNDTAGAPKEWRQTAAEHCEQRRNEAREAARVLNAECIHLDFKEPMFEKKGERERLDFKPVDLTDYPQWGRAKPPLDCAPDIDEAVAELVALLCRYEPELVLTHPPDEKPQHWATCVLSLKAFKQARRRVQLGTLYAWVDNRMATVRAGPDFFVDVTETIEIKNRALRKHASQGFEKRLYPSTRPREEYWGTFIGVPFAEAFSTLARGGEL